MFAPRLSPQIEPLCWFGVDLWRTTLLYRYVHRSPVFFSPILPQTKNTSSFTDQLHSILTFDRWMSDVKSKCVLVNWSKWPLLQDNTREHLVNSSYIKTECENTNQSTAAVGILCHSSHCVYPKIVQNYSKLWKKVQIYLISASGFHCGKRHRSPVTSYLGRVPVTW